MAQAMVDRADSTIKEEEKDEKQGIQNNCDIFWSNIIKSLYKSFKIKNK